MVEAPEMIVTGVELRARLIGTGVFQADMAGRLGLNESALSRILSGRDPMPEGFPERWDAAIADITRERYEMAVSRRAART